MECGEGLLARAKALGQTLLEERGGGLCVWSRGGRGGQGGEERSGRGWAGCAGPHGPGGGHGLFPQGIGSLVGLWAEEGRGLT